VENAALNIWEAMQQALKIVIAAINNFWESRNMVYLGNVAFNYRECSNKKLIGNAAINIGNAAINIWERSN